MGRFVLSPHGTGWLTEMLSPFQRIRNHCSSTTGLSWFSLTSSSSLSLSGAAASFILPMRLTLRFCRFYRFALQIGTIWVWGFCKCACLRVCIWICCFWISIYTHKHEHPHWFICWLFPSPKGAKCHRKCNEPTWTTMAYRKWSSKTLLGIEGGCTRCSKSLAAQSISNSKTAGTFLNCIYTLSESKIYVCWLIIQSTIYINLSMIFHLECPNKILKTDRIFAERLASIDGFYRFMDLHSWMVKYRRW